MPHKVRIALDAMGGDHGASVVVPGAEISLARHPDTEFLLFGNRGMERWVGPFGLLLLGFGTCILVSAVVRGLMLFRLRNALLGRLLGGRVLDD